MAQNCRSNWKIKIHFFRRPTAAIVHCYALRDDICAQGTDTQLSVQRWRRTFGMMLGKKTSFLKKKCLDT